MGDQALKWAPREVIEPRSRLYFALHSQMIRIKLISNAVSIRYYISFKIIIMMKVKGI